ncbi:otubain [Trifolium medium]|uniref:Otubain n=1 Tax=Trifolium medium TaxID=97028 RepID=A0A392MW64_9FABA|nr:otubain [Trifolium medium]
MSSFEIVGFTSTEKTFNVGDTTLMNNVAEVFPTTAALVCRFHVKKNVTTKCKLYCKVKDGEKVKQTDVWKNVMNSVEDVLDSPNEEAYVDVVVQFRKVCKKWPRFFSYVEETVLDTDKERVGNVWTDKFMHMGNITTNRAESSHGELKKILVRR